MENTLPPICIFGLGRMGSQIARRLNAKGVTVYAWNRSTQPVQDMAAAEIFATTDISLICNKTPHAPRIFWLMLPQGVVDDFLFGEGHLAPYLKQGDIVIDGGNSFYKDSMSRGARLQTKGIDFFDCGTSGGVWGEKNGFALMVGGPLERWPTIEPFIQALSSGDNYAYLGKVGAGHFTKMVHNGIEYGMMEAIAEGYGVLEASEFNLNLADVTRVYQKGSVIRSWLIDLCRTIFEEEDIVHTVGKIDATGEGEWTVGAGEELGVDVRVIKDALEVRRESIDPKNQQKFSNKIVALLRKQFGGHAVHEK